MSHAVLVCNGPSALGYKPEPMDYVVVINGGLAQYPKARALFNLDCMPEHEESWAAFKGDKITGAHTFPGYPGPAERYECKDLMLRAHGAGPCAAAWAADKGFSRLLVVGMDALLGAGHDGMSTAGHREILSELAPKFEEGLFILVDGEEVAWPDFMAKYGKIVPKAAPAPKSQAPLVGSPVVAPPVFGKVPRLVGYWTAGTPYEMEAKKLLWSIDDLGGGGIQTHIRAVPDLGSWQKNTQYKARFIDEMLAAYPGEPLLYVDADALILRRPVMPENIKDCDLAAVRYGNTGELLSGTVYFAPTAKCAEVVAKWQALCAQYPETLADGVRATDQKILDMAIRETPGARFVELPQEYTWIVGHAEAQRQTPGVFPVILHLHGEQRLAARIGEPLPEPWVVFPVAADTHERAKKTVAAWKSMGYRVAVLMEDRDLAVTTGATLPIDWKKWRGFPAAVNYLLRHLDGPVVCVAGDDILPDPNTRGPEIARHFLRLFPDTMGVMQPTGDKFGATDWCCISPWIGRKFTEKSYNGKGPYFDGYGHCYCDAELQDVATKLGCFAQVETLSQYHDHRTRTPDAPVPEHAKAGIESFPKDEALYNARKAEGFPGHEVEPQRRKAGRPRKVVEAVPA